MNDNNKTQQDENTKRQDQTAPNSKVREDEASREADKNHKQQTGKNNS